MSTCLAWSKNGKVSVAKARPRGILRAGVGTLGFALGWWSAFGGIWKGSDSALKKQNKNPPLAAVVNGAFVGIGMRMATLSALGDGWPRPCEQWGLWSLPAPHFPILPQAVSGQVRIGIQLFGIVFCPIPSKAPDIVQTSQFHTPAYPKPFKVACYQAVTRRFRRIPVPIFQSPHVCFL